MSINMILPPLLGASILLIGHEGSAWLRTSSISWAAEVNLSPGKTFRDPLKSGGDGPEMVTVPAGSFEMGDHGENQDINEVPVHNVSIQNPFAIGRYEVTFEEYDQYARAVGQKLPDDAHWGRARRPVIKITWQEATDYASWLSQQTGKRYRLPTEAEWEYAARAGTKARYGWGNDLTKGLANCNGCGSQWDGKQTAPVGSFKPNPFGLYDTMGNVGEWVQDCWHEDYKGAPADGSAWLDASGGDCHRRVVRGGSWYLDVSHPLLSRRHGAIAINSIYFIGFRVVREIE